MTLPDALRPALVYHGDAVLLLPSLPDACCDSLITDPPYSSGGAFRGDRTASTVTKYVMSQRQETAVGFDGDTRDQRSYEKWSANWLTHALRIVKPGGFGMVFTDWRQLASTIDAFQVAGWVYRGVVVWDKTEGARPQLGRPRSQCEFIVWGTNGPAPAVHPNSQTYPGVVRCMVELGKKEHIAQKPVPVLSALVRMVPKGGVVLDPFAGLATCGLACLDHDLRYLGMESNEATAKKARARLYRKMRGDL